MSDIPEFHFDYSAVTGMSFVDGSKVLFKQLEDHYNEYIKPQPFIFGAESVQSTMDVKVDLSNSVDAKDITPMENYEIKLGSEVGLKDGYVLTGVTTDGLEVFDKLITTNDNGGTWPTTVQGQSGWYAL